MEGGVSLLGLLRRGCHASADAPHRLVRNDHPRLVLKLLENWHDVDQLPLAVLHHCLDALLANRQGLTNGEDAHEARIQDVLQLGGQERTTLSRCRQAELTTTFGVPDQASLDAHL